MEAVGGAIRGGTAGCSSSVRLEAEQSREAPGVRSCRRSVFVGRDAHSSSRKGCVAKLHHRSGGYAARAQQSFADVSHAAFYSSGPGEERSTTAGVKASESLQHITLEYADDDDLRRQLGLLRSKLRRKVSKLSKQSAAASSSSSSSSSESSESEGEAERRFLKKERARQRLKAARDVSVNALPVLEERRSTSPVSTLPLLDDRAANPLDGYRLEQRVRHQPEVARSAEELDRLFNLSCKSLGNAAGTPGPDTSAESKARVEVCMGGKCKKLGAQSVLSAFQDSLPEAGVQAVACKCLKNCGKAVNVRFSQQGGEESEMQSQVDVEDVHQLLRQHFPQFATSTEQGA